MSEEPRVVLTRSSFAKQIYPSNFVPSPCHRWIKLLEERGSVSESDACREAR